MALRATGLCLGSICLWIALMVASAPLSCAPPQEAPSTAAPTATAAPPADTAFFADAPPYASAPVEKSAAAAHVAKKVSVSMPAVPACLTCHKPGGKGAPFLFADYSYYDGCWRRIWTAYGPRWTNVCSAYGYY